MTFTSQDLRQLSELGISKERVLSQIENFKKGFPFIALARPCRVGDGIASLDPTQNAPLIDLFDQAASHGRAMKFVPASGAATRMFHSLSLVYHDYEQYKNLLEQENPDHPDVKACWDCFSNIEKFAFSEEIPEAKKLIETRQYKKLLQRILTDAGPNYAALPKALIRFHRYTDRSRTALEEHLVEALFYARDDRGLARVHFTVSAEHRQACIRHAGSVRSEYEAANQRLEISFSEQKRSTDTIAVDEHNGPVRDENGMLFFRPAGHGALLENLNDLKGDIIFIKNIDNVVPDRLKETTYLYKKLLGGYLIQLQNRIFYYLEKIALNDLHESEITEAAHFARSGLSIELPSDFDFLPAARKNEMLFDKFDRPLRVCGMVKNQGEPGGGPFWARGRDGSISLQIVEKTQVDPQSEDQRRIWESSTHFNPVDLVCGVRDYKGENFDLHRFSDSDAGFISTKSKNGKSVKAMELPGLWNGGMAYWITVFVEVPLITFNPVKTINDLLRPEHQ